MAVAGSAIPTLAPTMLVSSVTLYHQAAVFAMQS
jgi:hypothetical protein